MPRRPTSTLNAIARLSLAALLTPLFTPRATATEPGPDKIAHLKVGAAAGAAGYISGALLSDEPSQRLWLGVTAGLVAGATKEIIDLTGAGTPSTADLLWTGLGGLLGAALSWALDPIAQPPRNLAPIKRPDSLRPRTPLGWDRGISCEVKETKRVGPKAYSRTSRPCERRLTQRSREMTGPRNLERTPPTPPLGARLPCPHLDQPPSPRGGSSCPSLIDLRCSMREALSGFNRMDSCHTRL